MVSRNYFETQVAFVMSILINITAAFYLSCDGKHGMYNMKTILYPVEIIVSVCFST